MWKILRDCYRRAKRAKVSKSGAASTCMKPYKYEQQLAFLAPSMSMRPTVCNIPDY